MAIADNPRAPLTPLEQSGGASIPKAPRSEDAGRNEQVCREVIAELDRERRRRQKAEAKLKETEAQVRHLRDDLISLSAQKDAFVDIINAITSDNDALAFAAASPSETLPLHDVRLLEIMPLDERVQGVAKKVDEVYEWQCFDATTNKWSNSLQSFPDDFKSLPVTKPSIEKKGDWTRRWEPGPEKALVLTDAACTHILNVDDGFPLPSRGTWKWVGGWVVELQHNEKKPCDNDGWSYATQPKLFLSKNSSGTSCCFDRARPNGSACPIRKFRRRKWTRRRVLISYPSISERTKCCLRLLAENASLELNECKLSDRLKQLQDALLCKTEKALLRNREMQNKIEKVTAELKTAEEKIQSLERSKPIELDCVPSVDPKCRVEPFDIESTKSRAFWYNILGAKSRSACVEMDTITEPSTSADDDSILSQDDIPDESVSARTGQDDEQEAAARWENFGGVFDRIVSNIPAKPKINHVEVEGRVDSGSVFDRIVSNIPAKRPTITYADLKERLERPDRPKEEVLRQKVIATNPWFGQPTVKYY